jgi:Rieske Fe-S protein
VRFRAGAVEGFLVNAGPTQELYALSAACTHMGCMLSWMDGAGTFLCPCHGAQYNANGTVLSGIARHPLPRLRLKIQPDGNVFVWSIDEHPAVTTIAPYNRA